MSIAILIVSNLHVAEMMGAVTEKPSGPYIVVRSRRGGEMYLSVDPEVIAQSLS